MKFILETNTSFMKNRHWHRVERTGHMIIWIYKCESQMVRLVEFASGQHDTTFSVMHGGNTEFFSGLSGALKRVDAITENW